MLAFHVAFIRRATRAIGWALAAAALMTLLAGRSPAAAASPLPASGSLTGSSSLDNWRFIGDVVQVDAHDQFVLSGTLAGSSETQRSCVVRLTDDVSICHGTETFTGTVAGAGAGTLTELEVDEVAPDWVGTFQRRYTIIHGTGALADVRGNGTVMGTFDLEGHVAGRYSGMLVMRP
jgi:hypothetical protein